MAVLAFRRPLQVVTTIDPASPEGGIRNMKNPQIGPSRFTKRCLRLSISFPVPSERLMKLPLPCSLKTNHVLTTQANKSFHIKQKLGKASKQNRPLPQWLRLKTNNTIRYNAKRRHWRRSKLNF
ncbi:hypothetical protein FT663_04314 [Candidozyma haemuli var. vulneris]|uniref:Large ribosomal subunit protein eL39 n=1 Tax=Candidozyma haemuli TaxID=45357 RepID=A0A2V1AP48_9ASCO|nr:60S ribosomal protein L39 [[Candida] haemuloni]KAF3986740.1 hypothetical protein FT662_04398 [[Candida] haemuloni var. vulneris]KAF3987794.1 hypothetical protein FT663_04314 [[Candida] haemuloni var. vulneris]PVH19023.1 60S ribosomal protein L39 [[Candida] haemuloni]